MPVRNSQHGRPADYRGAELMDAKGEPRTLHTAWMRADCVIRDERAGILEKLVRAGVRQVMIGVERDDAEGLAFLNKHNNGTEICREAFAVFRERYPQVFTIGTVIWTGHIALLWLVEAAVDLWQAARPDGPASPVWRGSDSLQGLAFPLALAILAWTFPPLLALGWAFWTAAAALGVAVLGAALTIAGFALARHLLLRLRVA